MNTSSSKSLLALYLMALLLAGASLLVGVMPVAAQELSVTEQSDDAGSLIALDDPSSKEAVRDMVSKLSDDAVRALLIQRLDAVADANAAAAVDSPGIVKLTHQIFTNYFTNARKSVVTFPSILETFAKVRSVLNVSQEHNWTGFLIVVMIAIAAGGAAERVVALLFRRHKRKLIAAVSDTLGGILKILYTRLTYDILGVLAFSLISYIVISNNFAVDSTLHQLAYIFTGTIVGGWMAYVICRFFFAPRRPDLRICKTTDQRAMRVTVSFSLLAAYVVFIHNLFMFLLQIGTQYYDGIGYMQTLGFWMNLSMYIAAAFVIWFNRAGLTEILFENKKRVYLGIGETSPVEPSWFANHWPQIAIGLIVFKYLLVEIIMSSTDVGSYSQGAVYITLTTIFLWPGIDANVTLFVGKGIRSAENESENAGIARRNMQQGLLRVGRILVVGVVVYMLSNLWGLNLIDLASSGLGAQTAGVLVELLLILLFAYILWELVAALADYWLAQENAAVEDSGDGGGEIGGTGLSRVATLLPIMRKTAQFVIVLVSIVMILSKLGVNIGPILAGAGVVGLAIGFGAQTLVKDIVSGMFFLADDAFRVGEYIDASGTMGSVEKISVRSLRLRHHMGLVHTIPYGEIPKLTNYSRDWVIVKLRFRVPFDTDVQKVKKIFKTIGADLINDPVLGEDFLQPFKSQGVAEVDDNGIIIRGKFMAKPGKQFMIRKEVYVRVQKAFDEAGIPFARKQVMVHIPGLENTDRLDEEQTKAIGAAAADAVDETAEPAKK
ncbi:MAG: mechanosensitive ion channel [Granulosicoccus sp.]|nr:mechanosensitive ion channel [Granulosicoccus sp.]